jgi:alkaline phosphatase
MLKGKAKNVILLIADGMGEQHREAIQYATAGMNGRLAMDQLQFRGQMSTSSLSSIIADSASAGTAMAAGIKTNHGAIGVDMTGKPVETVLEKAIKSGKTAGLITNGRVTDGGLAAFAAHSSADQQTRDIARRVLESGVDLIFGGGRSDYDEDVLLRAVDKGYTFISKANELHGTAAGTKLLGLFAEAELFTDPVVSLPQMTMLAIERLSKHESGFFLVVQDKALDAKSREYNGKLMIRAGQELDQAVAVAKDYAGQAADTLVLVLGGYESGNLAVKLAGNDATVGRREGSFEIAGSPEHFILKWAAAGSTEQAVPVTAMGPGAERFAGAYENTYIHDALVKAMGLDQDECSAEAVVIKTGHFNPGRKEFIYVPIEVPVGVSELHFKYEYTNRPRTALDIAVFDPRGYDTGNVDGFRGSSGGGLSEFMISASAATPGYIAGEILPGTWHVGLGPYRVADEGSDWKLTVTKVFGEPGPAFVPKSAPVKLNDTPGWYRGDTHLHSSHSGGVVFPQEQIAREAVERGLDFIVSTEYYTTSNHREWGHHARPDLLIMNGEEVVTRTGHYNAVGLTTGNWIDYRYRPAYGILPQMIQRLNDDGAIGIVNHPMAGCGGCFWEFPFTGMHAIEVWNGPWTKDDDWSLKLWDGMLRNGPVLTAVGASDDHGPGDKNVLGTAQTVVAADSLSTADIIAGIKAGRVYVAESSAVTLEMAATAGNTGAGIGGRLRCEPDAAVEICLRVRGAAGTHVTFHTEEGIVHAAAVSGEDETVTWIMPTHPKYARAEVRRSDTSMVAFTNPVWINGDSRDGNGGPGETIAMVGRPDGSSLEFVLSPNGYQHYLDRFPEGVDFTAGKDDPAKHWSYIQPGPMDVFAGSREHPFKLRFNLEQKPAPGEKFKLIVWLLDTPVERADGREFYPAAMRVECNGGPLAALELSPGGGAGYHWGDGVINFSGIRPRSLEAELRGEMLRKGENTITITLTKGSWVVYDAVGVFRIEG